MKVKKFVAVSMPDAMKLIRSELGNDAVILNSKIIYTGGFLGFFKKKNIEVIAAIDPKPRQEQKPVIKEKQKPSYNNNSTLSTLINTQSKKEEQAPQPKIKQTEEILKEVNELKEALKKLSDGKEQISSIIPAPVKELMSVLNRQEISNMLKDECLETMLEAWYTNGGSCTKEQLLFSVKEKMAASLSEKSFGGISFTKKFVNVVGPTGVGKTTTLAKIAADCMLKHNKKVAFITTDTYRIAAIEQLRTYAKILDIPVEVCYGLEDFQEAVKKFNEYDLVLIDTAGRNFRNKKYVEDLHKVIDFKNEMETFLVLALTAKQSDMEEIFEQFSIIGIDRLIFTKADETSIYGAMVNMVERYKIGVAYITNGQDVPDDMVSANPDVITNFLLGVE